MTTACSRFDDATEQHDIALAYQNEAAAFV